MRRPITLAAVIGVAAVLTSAALAATGTPFGGATQSNGVLTLISNTGDSGSANDASGANFTGTGVTTFSSIATMSTEFDVTDDDCSGGSPRFQIQVQTPSGAKNVFVYLGPAPSFTGCSPNVWITSGNLIGSTDGRFDTSQVQPGTQVSTYAQAQALVGSYQVTGISLVVDSGWAFADKEQTVMARNVKINDSTFFTPGWTEPRPGSGDRQQPGAGVQAASGGPGCRRVPCRLRHQPQRSERVRQVRLEDGAHAERRGARGRRHADRPPDRPLPRAHDDRPRQGKRKGQGHVAPPSRRFRELPPRRGLSDRSRRFEVCLSARPPRRSSRLASGRRNDARAVLRTCRPGCRLGSRLPVLHVRLARER